jgi:hypothetical protein
MSEKRRRISTPKKAGEVDFLSKFSDDTKAAKAELCAALKNIKVGKITDVRDSIVSIFTDQVIPWFENQASTISDLGAKVEELESVNAELRAEADELRNTVGELEKKKESDEVKASRSAMECKVKEASLQVKIMDLDFGKEIKERKELQEKASEILTVKVRSDLRDRYDALCKKASKVILAKQTTKHKVGGNDIWTAPVLLGFQDRSDKWEMEDLLRKSKLFPAYHWPKEMIEPVKQFRKVVRDTGVCESDTFIRIRPAERDGKSSIRAEIKKKEGTGKFTTFAVWDVPPMDSNIRDKVADWDKPVWTAKKMGGANSAQITPNSQSD